MDKIMTGMFAKENKDSKENKKDIEGLEKHEMSKK